MLQSEALKILGFVPGTDPTEVAIKKRFKKLATKFHPDKIKYPPDSTDDEKAALLKQYNERFDLVRKAYEELTGTVKPVEDKACLIIKLSRDADSSRDTFTVEFDGDREKFRKGLAQIFEEQKYSWTFVIEFYGNYESLIPVVKDELLKHLYFSELIAFDPIRCIKPFSDSQLRELSEHKVQNTVRRNLKQDTPQEAAAWAKNLQEAMAEFAAMRKKELRNKKSEKYSPLLYEGLFSVIAAVLSAFSLFTLPFVFLFALVGGLVGYLRRNYIIKSSEYYDESADIQNIDSDGEIEALQCGLDAVTWKGYFISYTHLSTYRHPMAFAGGYVQAIIENDRAIDAIKEKNKRHP